MGIVEIDLDGGPDEAAKLLPMGISLNRLRGYVAADEYLKKMAAPDGAPVAEPNRREDQIQQTFRRSTIECHQKSADKPLPRLDLWGANAFGKERLDPLALRDANPALFSGYRIEAIKVVEEVVGEVPPPLVPPTMELSIRSQFFQEHGTTERTAKFETENQTLEAGVHVFANTRLEGSGGFEFLGSGGSWKSSAGIEGKAGYWYRSQWGTIKETGEMGSDRTRLGVMEASKLYVESRTFSLPLEMRWCLLFTPIRGEGRPILACIKKQETWRETWQYVADFDFHHELSTDRRDLRERMILKLIRGQRAFEAFRSQLTGPVRRYEIRSDAPLGPGINVLLQDLADKTKNPKAYFRDGGLFPGVLDFHGAN